MDGTWVSGSTWRTSGLLITPSFRLGCDRRRAYTGPPIFRGVVISSELPHSLDSCWMRCSEALGRAPFEALDGLSSRLVPAIYIGDINATRRRVRKPCRGVEGCRSQGVAFAAKSAVLTAGYHDRSVRSLKLTAEVRVLELRHTKPSITWPAVRTDVTCFCGGRRDEGVGACDGPFRFAARVAGPGRKVTLAGAAARSCRKALATPVVTGSNRCPFRSARASLSTRNC
jgi:hypothetical protein